ncbi:ribosome maturation factor RimM [Fulvivirga sediminis]|uniref:Ribosome maturation factor RimM n=1 Tax=Fulvivirga sediminis TaxID=2803949 RepID=A0A937JZ50_9BACT|nr:ribosome maturation factor RimM [Fulvivirga sediminis]MBL3654806.1 16S rRNA processing protein RimM [Fulvivirga sediminis]
MNIDECFQLGYIIKKHGLKGEVNVLLDVDDPQYYQELESVFVEINKKLVPFFIDSLSLKGNKAVVKFEDVDTAELADELIGNSLFLPLAVLPKLSGNQFYFHEIMGYEVIDETQGSIGEVKDVYASPQQDLLAVDFNQKEILVPINDEIILSVSHEEKKVKVSLPEGLLDIYLE